jgi:hypothetical protein
MNHMGMNSRSSRFLSVVGHFCLPLGAARAATQATYYEAPVGHYFAVLQSGESRESLSLVKL